MFWRTCIFLGLVSSTTLAWEASQPSHWAVTSEWWKEWLQVFLGETGRGGRGLIPFFILRVPRIEPCLAPPSLDQQHNTKLLEPRAIRLLFRYVEMGSSFLAPSHEHLKGASWPKLLWSVCSARVSEVKSKKGKWNGALMVEEQHGTAKWIASLTYHTPSDVIPRVNDNSLL